MNELKEEKTAGSRLHYFPVSFFAIVMGLTGFAIALTKAEEVLGLNVHLATEVTGLAAVIFLLILIAYLAKIWHYPLAVGKELRHPVKLSFFPTISISLILLSVALLNRAAEASLWLWSMGSVLQLLLTLFVMSRWINGTHFEVSTCRKLLRTQVPRTTWLEAQKSQISFAGVLSPFQSILVHPGGG